MPDTAAGRIVKWTWYYDSNQTSVLQNPATILSAGTHLISLQAESDKGCHSIRVDSMILVHPKPEIALALSDSCVFRTIQYTASSINNVPVSRWTWNFGHGEYPGSATITKRFVQEDLHTVTLIGQSDKSCKDTLLRPVTIYYNRTKAVRDTIAAKNQPVQLNTASVLIS